MKTALLTPYFGGIDIEHLGCIEHALKEFPCAQFRVFNCSLIDHARAYLADIALGLDPDEYDTVVWIDHDILFDVDNLRALVRQVRATQAMVGAPTIIKKPMGPLMLAGVEGDVIFGEEGGLYRCKGIGFGFTGMPIDLLRLACEEAGTAKAIDGSVIHPAFQCRVLNGAYASEDYSFCDYVLQAGGRVYVDTRIRVGHKGSYVYTHEDTGYSVPQIETMKVHFKKAE